MKFRQYLLFKIYPTQRLNHKQTGNVSTTKTNKIKQTQKLYTGAKVTALNIILYTRIVLLFYSNHLVDGAPERE